MTSRRRLKLTKTSCGRRGRADVMRGVKSLDQGAAVLVAGLAARHSNQQRSLAAYREIDASTIAPVQVASETEREASRDVTLRYVMGP